MPYRYHHLAHRHISAERLQKFGALGLGNQPRIATFCTYLHKRYLPYRTMRSPGPGSIQCSLFRLNMLCLEEMCGGLVRRLGREPLNHTAQFGIFCCLGLSHSAAEIRCLAGKGVGPVTRWGTCRGLGIMGV